MLCVRHGHMDGMGTNFAVPTSDNVFYDNQITAQMCSNWLYAIAIPDTKFLLRFAIKIIYYYLFTQSEGIVM